MTTRQLFPAALIVLNLCAAVAHAAHGASNWRMVVYWCAAAALNYVVTF